MARRRATQAGAFTPTGSPAQLLIGGKRVEAVVSVQFAPVEVRTEEDALRLYGFSSPIVGATTLYLRGTPEGARDEALRQRRRKLDVLRARVEAWRSGLRVADDTPLPLP